MGRIFERNGAWFIDYRVCGKRVKKKIGSKADARVALQAIESRIARGEFGVLDNEYPFDDLARLFMKHSRLKLRPSSIERNKGLLKNLRQDFKGKMASGIVLSAVDEYCDRRLSEDGVSRRTVNLEVGLLKQILRFGVERQLIAFSPLASLKPLKQEGKRFRRALKPEEVRKLLKFSTDRMRPLWVCYLTTGMRKSEAVCLKWKDVDMVAAAIRLQGESTKTGRGRVIPIAPMLLIEFKCLRLAAKRDATYVFLTERGTVRKNNLLRQLRGTLHRAGVDTEGIDIHSLRYTFATQLARNGVHPKVAQELLGHKDIGMTMRIYTEVDDTDRRDAIDNLSYDDSDEKRPSEGPDDEELSQGVVG